MKQILIIAILFSTVSLIGQACFTYDAAGNRIKRQVCINSIPYEEYKQIQQWAVLQGGDIQQEEDGLVSLVIYPNPTSGAFSIIGQHSWVGAQLQLVSLDGILIATIIISEDMIDLTRFPSGTYYLVLKKGTITKTAKLFITK